jgi:uncharacterized membrane protein YgcG
MTSPSITQLASVAPGVTEAAAFVAKFNEVILFPLIMLMTGIAMLYFIYGCVIYIMNAENSEARETGRNHIIYSVVGMFVMLSAYGLLMVAANTFGLNDVLDCSKTPTNSKCNNVMRLPGSGSYSGGGIQSGGTSGGAVQSGGASGGGVQGGGYSGGALP